MKRLPKPLHYKMIAYAKLKDKKKNDPDREHTRKELVKATATYEEDIEVKKARRRQIGKDIKEGLKASVNTFVGNQ